MLFAGAGADASSHDGALTFAVYGPPLGEYWALGSAKKIEKYANQEYCVVEYDATHKKFMNITKDAMW